jgi:transcription antitermination factor NusG
MKRMAEQLYYIGKVVEYINLMDLERDRPAEPTLSDTAKWFCVMTNPNCQGRAALGLYAAGYRTFMPKVRKWVSHARVRKAVEKPLLGRYLFVEVDHPRQSFGAVKAVNGVETLISTLGKPIEFPEHWVNNLKLRYMAGEWDFVRHEQSRPIFKWDKKKKCEVMVGVEQNDPLPLGARIRIVEGEFENLLATVTNRKGGRVTFKLKDANTYHTMHECSVRAA